MYGVAERVPGWTALQLGRVDAESQVLVLGETTCKLLAGPQHSMQLLYSIVIILYYLCSPHLDMGVTQYIILLYYFDFVLLLYYYLYL